MNKSKITALLLQENSLVSAESLVEKKSYNNKSQNGYEWHTFMF